MSVLIRTELGYRRLFTAFGFLATAVVAGATAYHTIGGGRWSWFECFYMTLITLSTVGFGETLEGMHTLPEARLITVGLIIFGSGALLYFVSSLTALIVEGDVLGMLRHRRMERQIELLRNHIVVCGVGTTGYHIVQELLATQQPFVAIDQDIERLEELALELGRDFLFVVGDATADMTLERAGIADAKGVIAAVNDDKANLFITISAKALNARARVVAKAIEQSTEPKLRRAGADGVVSPNFLGGVRLVGEMLRPQTLAFLDRLFREQDEPNIRIAELLVHRGSPVVGEQLSAGSILETGALIVAVQKPDGEFVYNPPRELEIEAGAHLIVFAQVSEVEALRRLLASEAAPQ